MTTVAEKKHSLVENGKQRQIQLTLLHLTTLSTEGTHLSLLDQLKQLLNQQKIQRFNAPRAFSWWNIRYGYQYSFNYPSHGPGYIEKDLEQVVGLQTDKPLKRALMTFGGINMAVNSCKAYGYEVDEEVIKIFTDYRKTHNQGVFDAILQKCVQ